MLDLFVSGGWLMLPILGCSVIALAIIAERLWTLRTDKVAPSDLLPNLLHALRNNNLTNKNLNALAAKTPLGSVLSEGIQVITKGSPAMKARMEEQGRHIIHKLEKYLNLLGTIAAITPLLGLLGTVTGMIEVFSVITLQGTSDASALAGGISQALLTTAFGLAVAIPSLMFHRHFNRKIDEFAVSIEQEANKLVDTVGRVEDIKKSK